MHDKLVASWLVWTSILKDYCVVWFAWYNRNLHCVADRMQASIWQYCNYNCKQLLMLQAGASFDKKDPEARTTRVGCKCGHPVIVQQDGCESAFSVFCDGHLIPCGSSVTEALDCFLKFIWISNLEYTCRLTNFFEFFEFKIY